MIIITDKIKCTGCEACRNACPKHCIKMIEDKEGFFYPQSDEKMCNNCGYCERACPILQNDPINEIKQRAFLVRCQDETICKASTSGGAFSAIAQSVIQKNGVVFGAVFNEDFDVYHDYTETEEGLEKFRNSKYVQSRIGHSYQKVKEFLNNGRLVLFSGTPCQIEGLYYCLNGNKDNLIMVDTVCHAVPSPLIWRKYKEYCKPNENVKLIAASFRDKTKYGYQYSQMKMTYDNGYIRYCGVESDPYLRAFFTNLSDRPSCYGCAFKKRYRISDLTIWDCFDVYRIDKRFDDNKGVTRILAHSEKGIEIIKHLNECIKVEIDVELAISGVKEMIESVKMNSRRTSFFDDCYLINTTDFFVKWFPDTVKVKGERLIRQFCETLGIYRPVKRVARKLLGKE